MSGKSSEESTYNDSGPNSSMPRDAIPPHADGAGLIFGGPVAAWLRERGGYALRGFRNADYRRYWFMMLADTFGLWSTNTAAVWLAYDLSGNDERVLGWFIAASTFTAMMLLPFTGAVADRFNRRAVVACVQIARVLLAAAVAVLVFQEAIGAWHLVVVAGLVGSLNAFRQPATQSILANVVKPKDLPNAVALNHVQVNLTRIVAPLIAGSLIAHVGAFWPFVLQVVAGLCSLLLLATMRYSGKAPRPNTHVLKALRGGVRYVLTRGDLMTIYVLVLLSAALGQISVSMLPALAKESFDGGPAAFGMLSAFFALGALVGAFTLASRRGGPLSLRLVCVALVGWGCLQVLMGLAGSFAMALGLVVCVGVSFTFARAGLFAGMHVAAPDHVRGRISSFYTLSVMAGAGTGGWVAGQLAERIGIQSVFEVFGVALLLLAPLVVLVARRFNADQTLQLEPDAVRKAR